jgi:hypothetical protein
VEGEPYVVGPIGVLDPQPQTKPIYAQRTDLNATPQSCSGKALDDATQHVGGVLLEMPQPGVLKPAEWVGFGVGEGGWVKPTAALTVGEHCKDRVQPQQVRGVPNIEQARVWTLFSPPRRSASGLIPGQCS